MENLLELFKEVLTHVNEVDSNKKMSGKEKKEYVVLMVSKTIRAMYGDKGAQNLFLVEPIIEFIIMLSKSEMIIKVNRRLKKSLLEKLETMKITCCVVDDPESDVEVKV